LLFSFLNILSDIDFSYAVLHKVSRSFAVVIQQLADELKDVICIFYLVLRGLDSVEDDMDFPIEQKLPLLRSFYEKLEIEGWNISGVGDSEDYKQLMAAFEKVSAVYRSLKPEYRVVISDITKRMGEGMAEFAEKTAKTGKGAVTNVEEYNHYCHYVAGLVGIGLTQLFAASKLEDTSILAQEKLANSMGLFLQKTNIIRDYLEDLEEARTWWPEDIWSQYAPSLDWFAKNPDHPNSRACLNHMVSDAFSLVPDVLQYLALLKERSVFEFCAIPQVMAMATLAKVYNNTDVFKKNVKIRKGLSCDMMLHSSDVGVVKGYFRYFAKNILDRIDSTTVNQGEATKKAEATAKRTRDLVNVIMTLTTGATTRDNSYWYGIIGATGVITAASYYWYNSTK